MPKKGAGKKSGGGASVPKKDDPVMSIAVLTYYPVLKKLGLDRETFLATMRAMEGMLPADEGHPDAAGIRELCANWGLAFIKLEGQGDLENKLDEMPFMHAGLLKTLAATIVRMSQVVSYSRVGLALLANEYYRKLQTLAVGSIVPPGKQESSAQDGGSLPAPFTASLVRYLLSIIPVMLPGRDLLRVLMSVSSSTGLFDMGVLLDGECLRSASGESVEAVPNPQASDRLSDMLRRLAQDDQAELYRVSWLTEDPVLHKPLWAWVSVLRGEEGTSVTAMPTETGEMQSPTPTQEQQKEKDAQKGVEQEAQQQEQQGEGSGESGVEEQRPQAGSEAGGGAEASKIRLQIRFSATEEPVEVEDGAKLVRSLQQWLESLVLVSTFLVSFWAVKGVNVIEKAGFPVSKTLDIASCERQVYTRDAAMHKRWGYINLRLGLNTLQLVQSVATEGRTLVLHAECGRRWRQREWKCQICREVCDDDKHLRMALRPCGHMACLTCCRSLAAGQESFACPFCRTTIVAEPMKDIVDSDVAQKMRQGGQVFHMAFPSFMPACEMADLANKASDVKGRPSTPIELVKIMLYERGGTVGTATGFVEDGLQFRHLMLQKGPGAIFLFTSCTKDGRYECASLDCKEMEPEDGSKKWATCGQCHVTRYCSRECQRTDWEEWGHRRICKMYKQRFLDQTAADATTAPLPQEDGQVSSKEGGEKKEQGRPLELAIDLDVVDDD